MITILTLIVLLSFGAVSAQNNSTELSIDNNMDKIQNNDIETIINDSHDGDIIKLDEKTYDFIAKNESGENHILLNKSLTFDGVKNKTVIESNDTIVYFDCVEPIKDLTQPQIGGLWNGYEVKDTGKTVIFNNITFINFKLVSCHEMIFNNCLFMNSNFTSYEKNSTFNDCIFNNTKVESTLLEGMDIYSHSLNINECIFYTSIIATDTVYTNTYIAIVGGSRFYTLNNFNLTNSQIYDSRINIGRNCMNLKNSKLFNTESIYWSDSIEIEGCELNDNYIELHMSEITIYNSTVTKMNIQASAGYFSRGSAINLNKTELNNTNISMVPDLIYSQKSNFKSSDSTIKNSEINTTDATVSIENTTFNNTHMLLFFSDMVVKNSTFFDYRSIADGVKTKNYTEINDKIQFCLVKTNYTCINSYIVNNTGKYLINSADIQIDTLHKLTVPKKQVYCYGEDVIIKLNDYKGKPVANKEINIVDLKTYDTYKIKTNKNGIATFKLKKLGKLSFIVYYTSPGFSYREIEHDTELKLKVNKAKTTVKAPKVTSKFKKSRYFKITLKNKATKKAISNVKVKIKVYTGKKYKTFTVKTAKNGIAKINTKSLKIGNHKVVISSGDKNYIISAKSAIKIKK